MLEKPDIPDQLIIARVAEAYALSIHQLTFLPLGADVNSAVYRAVAQDETPFFLKLRKGDFDAISVAVPQMLSAQGIQAIIAPIETHGGLAWAELDAYRMAIYPFIEGKNGYEVMLSEDQWRDFGAALKRIHGAQVPAALAARIPRETFSAQWRAMVTAFQAQVEQINYDEPTAARVAAFMREKRQVIQQLVAQTDALGLALRTRSLEMVLCHADIHAGNLLLPPDSAGGPISLFIVDWDNPIFAPKERDLAMIGGSFVWNQPHQAALFYQGYGEDAGAAVDTPAVDAPALRYYRGERAIQDIAAYCQELLLSDAGGQDREQSYKYFTSSFMPGHEVDLAMQNDRLPFDP